ncbi:MAG TPA: tetratricopeptide repeat protein [bacterium]|jgi:TolA-binding protein|nr:tetratricopeptide repeat protein [bacterium]HXK60727.1 tetratricopeptide repeat protein [Acidobacteriota bacterium]
MFKRFDAQWTPTGIILDPEGKEQHRFEGFLPVDEFLAQLQLGLAKVAFSHNQFQEAEKRFQEIVDQFPDSEAAPEALYWAGVSRYKETDDGAALTETGRQFQKRYQDTIWAKKASVWAETPV